MFSPIIIGCMRWGKWGANLDIKQSQLLIETSLQEGFNSFDHADIYGDYTTEALFGNAFSGMSIPRDHIRLISKCAIQLKSEKQSIKSYNYDKAYIIKSVENSLINLKTDYLDSLLLHRPSPLMDPIEISEAFSILHRSGKVKTFGVSNFTTSQFDLINQYYPISTNQVEISVNKTKAFYDGTLDQMLIHKLQPMAWSVLGNYFHEDTEQNIILKPIIRNLAQKYEVEESHILISFLLKHPSKILPIVGTTDIDKIKSYPKLLTINLENDEWFAILEASRGYEVE